MEAGSRRIAVESKASTSPKVSRGFWNALEDLEIDEAFVVAPVNKAYPLERNVEVLPITETAERIASRIRA